MCVCVCVCVCVPVKGEEHRDRKHKCVSYSKFTKGRMADNLLVRLRYAHCLLAIIIITGVFIQ